MGWLVRMLAILSAALASASAASAQGCDSPRAMSGPPRFALVIGIGDYDRDGRAVPGAGATRGGLGDLPNAGADGDAMRAKLCRLGFDVTHVANPAKRELEQAVAIFGRKLLSRPDAIVVVFYAGHAVQIGGENWLLPAGARLANAETMIGRTEIEKLRQVGAQAVPLSLILDQLPQPDMDGGGANIIVIDACRDNPWEQSLYEAPPGAPASRGLAAQAPPGRVGTVIVYSTASGAPARDGDPGANSPFTTALLAYIEEPGMPIEELLRRVRVDVFTATLQAPWELGSLLTPFCFGGCERAPEPPLTPRGGCPDDPASLRPFLLFFDWDDPGLAPGAHAILDFAAVAYARDRPACVVVRGPNFSADPSNPARARIESVRAYLIRRGIPDRAIIVRETPGEDEGGVRDPQRRYIEVLLPV